VKASDKIWVCEKGHVDDHHVDDGGLCLTCGGVPVYQEGTMGPQTVGQEPKGKLHRCPACKDSPGRAINALCSRCGGTCERVSLDALAREYRERLVEGQQ
jgi:hypothetical protein